MATTAKPNVVAYLLGAGASQAEVDSLGAEKVRVLMTDHPTLGEGVSTGILKQIGKKWTQPLTGDYGVDVEKLISLLNASGIPRLTNVAQSMRRCYVDEVQRRLVKAKVIGSPHLAIALLQFHQDAEIAASVEFLSGILTTNHDGLLQSACQIVYGGINVGFKFRSSSFDQNAAIPPLLQLHGSFTWRAGLPVRVTTLDTMALS